MTICFGLSSFVIIEEQKKHILRGNIGTLLAAPEDFLSRKSRQSRKKNYR